MNLLLRCLVWCVAALGAACWPAVSWGQDAPGVRVEYFNYTGNPPSSVPASGAVVDRVESNIAVLRSTASPAPGVGSDNYLARYTGSILIPSTGAYTFQVEADDGVRLSIDCNGDGIFQAGELLLDRWVDQSTTAYQVSCSNNLTAGTRYKFKLEYYERGGEQSVRLSWAGPSPVGSTFVVVPKGNATQGLYSGVIDTTRPTISSAQLACGATSQILVTFSETVDPTTAQTAANYSLSGGHTITSAVLAGDGTAVALTMTPAMTATRTLTVNNVKDLAGNVILANSTQSVPFAPTTLAGGLVGSYYNQNGVARAYFGGTQVDRTDSTVDFDWGGGTPGVTNIGANDFSVRWTGLILVPTTGNYVFRTQSDDGVRLYINGTKVIDNWTDHSPSYDISSSVTLNAGSYVPVTLEFFERGGGAVIRLQWATPGSSSYVAIPASQLFHCVPATVASFAISGTGSASTCVPQTLTITARDSTGSTITNYTGTVNLSTSTTDGDWTAGLARAPQGTLTPGAANSGLASYQFAVADAGSVQLRLSHSLAQNLTFTVVDPTVPSSSTTSATISFRDNAFVWAEDLSNRIAGSNVVVAGRPHDMQVSLIKKDPTTGSCGVATDFTGSRNLKLWRADGGGTWTAPTVVSPALTIPAARPASNNLALSFNAGVASLNLGTTDIGKYTLNLDDDSLTYAATTVSGSIGDLIVRPFTLAINSLVMSGVGNPGGSLATDAVFGKAGAAFTGLVSAYRWSSTADSNSDGIPDAGATLAQVSASGLTPSYGTAVSLTALAGSQTPTAAVGGVLGTFSSGVITSQGSGTVSFINLSYSEAGSFQFNTTGVVSNFLSSGVALDATVFNASGAQVNRVGRFVPAGFAVSGVSTVHRSAQSCAPASSFTYLDEDFTVGFTLTAQNTAGGTTKNYTDTFAKLGLTTPANFNLAGIGGTTMFKSGGRLSTSASTGTWATGGSAGTAAVTLTAKAARAATADGPFDTAQFGIAPVDADNVGMLSFNLDTDSPANGTDRTLLGQIPLRYGRLRLQNGMSAANRPLTLPLSAQYWNGTAFITNPLDACTRVTAANLSFGNFRKTLTAADAVMSPSTVTVNPSGTSAITLAAPGGGRVGSLDLAIALGAGAPPADQSCLKTSAGWTATTAATTGANATALRGAWCGSAATSDPSARAVWGLYRGSNGVIYQRENY